ncbi:HNH endonuclease [Chitinophaga sp. RCC_12]|uniref:HNH endonuclease n=1 Tax=Chitinophaga sp. RCC_12 TaxID=3239226 RepID=UPI00352627BF
MNICYVCKKSFVPKTELSEGNISLEHIIPNSLGGSLKSKELLCKSCNSMFGETCDAHLSKQFSHIASLLMIERDRGEIQPIKGGKNEDGDYTIHSGYKPAIAHPIFNKKEIEPGKTKIEITARDLTEMKKILSGLARKNPGFNAEEAMKRVQISKEYLAKPIQLNFGIGDSQAFKAITKIAANYYVHTQNECEQISKVIEYLKTDVDAEITFHYNPNEKLYPLEDNEVCHLLHLVGDNINKILYCYIDLFSSFSFLVLLSDNYTGQSFSNTYAYDILKRKEVSKPIFLNFSKKQIHSILSKNEILNDNESVTNKLNRLATIIHKLHNDVVIGKLSQIAADKTLKRHPEGTPISKEMLNEYLAEVAESYASFLLRESKIKK